MRHGNLELKGQLFGRLTAEELAAPPEGKPQNRTYWLCRCVCGGTEVIMGSELTGNRRRQCSRCTNEVHNIEGREYGTWKVQRKALETEIPNTRSAEHQSWWRVKCVLCGAEAIRNRGNLRKLHKQCGCIERQQEHARPFVSRMNADKKLNRTMQAKTKECAWCGKVFELECIGQWGWNIGHDLFCTYRCMRKAEEARKGKNKRGARFA